MQVDSLEEDDGRICERKRAGLSVGVDSCGITPPKTIPVEQDDFNIYIGAANLAEAAVCETQACDEGVPRLSGESMRRNTLFNEYSSRRSDNQASHEMEMLSLSPWDSAGLEIMVYLGILVTRKFLGSQKILTEFTAIWL